MACDHNCIPCRGGWRERFRVGWVCVRCDRWFQFEPPRLYEKRRSVGLSTTFWR